MEDRLRAHLDIDLSGMRRVLAATDLHGRFEAFDATLEAIGHDPAVDAIVLCGDLCDRGPDSADFERVLAMPNVHRTLGNHDEAPSAFLEGLCDADALRSCGASWFLALDEAERTRVARILLDAPIAMTVSTPARRRVGFVHADCGDDWAALVATLSGPPSPLRASVRRDALYGRETIQALFRAVAPDDGSPPRPYSCRISGVDHVFHGHSFVARPIAHHDRTWFDTGMDEGGAGWGAVVVDVDAWLDRIADVSPFV